MQKRGRKSAGELSTGPLVPSPRGRPKPPSSLSPSEKRAWTEIVASLRADWFEPETLPLLADYCRYSELSTRISKELRGIAVSDPRFAPLLRQKLAASNWVVRLATKLRLTKQATTSTRTNIRRALPPQGPPPNTFTGWGWGPDRRRVARARRAAEGERSPREAGTGLKP